MAEDLFSMSVVVQFLLQGAYIWNCHFYVQVSDDLYMVHVGFDHEIRKTCTVNLPPY